MAEIWAAVALGWRWSFTVYQPGLGIVTRVSMGGLKGRKGREQGRMEGRKGGGGGGGEQGSKGEKRMKEGREGGAAQCVCVTADD